MMLALPHAAVPFASVTTGLHMAAAWLCMCAFVAVCLLCESAVKRARRIERDWQDF